MFVRHAPYGDDGKITATLQWDSGDPSVGIPAGWGEETGIEIELDGWTVYLSWSDYDWAHHKPLHDPAEWIVDDFEIATGPSDPRAKLPTALAVLRGQIRSRLLSLSELPDALGVVRAVWGDWRAAERLLAASEALFEVSGEIDRVIWDAEQGQGLEGIALLNLLDELRKVENAARRELEIATIIDRDRRGIRDYSNQRGEH